VKQRIVPCNRKELIRCIRELARKYRSSKEALEKVKKRSLFHHPNLQRISVLSLRSILDSLKVPYWEVDELLGYPIDLANPGLWKLAVHILNEGHIDRRKLNATYYNKDPVLHYYVYELGGRPAYLDKGAFKSYIPVEYSQLLINIGVPIGNKTINMPNFDLSILSDDLFKYYLQATLTEEGSFSVTIEKGRKLRHKIEFKRTIDISRYVPNLRKYIRLFGQGYYSIGSTKKYYDLYKAILLHPHPYLQREIYEIMRRNPLISDAILIYPDSMRITKDDRITVQ